MTIRRPAIAVVLLGLASATGISCDTIEDAIRPSEITFEGVTYALLGDAEFRESDDGLVIENIGSSGNDGVRIETDDPIEEADFRFLPVDIPANGRWGMQVHGQLDGSRTALATVWNEAVSPDEHEIIFEFASAMQVSEMILEYYLDGRLQHSAQVPANGTGNRSRATPAGRGTDGPTSVHVICVNGELIVATDHGGGAPRTTPQGCSGTFLTDVPGSEVPVCTDFIRAVPITELAFPEASSLDMTARTLPEFTITDGSVAGPQ